MSVKSTGKFNETAAALQRALQVFENNLLGLMTEVENQHTAFDFSDANTSPSYVDEDADGNISGFLFTPQDYLDGVNVLMQLMNFYNNIAVPTASYGDVVSSITGI